MKLLLDECIDRRLTKEEDITLNTLRIRLIVDSILNNGTQS